VVSGEYKLNGRIEVLEAIAAALGREVPATPPPMDPAVEAEIRKRLGLSDED
jgi:hypothetical protein